MRLLTAYVATFLVFIGMDAVWLTTMTRPLYQHDLGPLLLAHPRLAPGVLFYVLYMVGLTALAVAPALKSGDWRRAALSGGLFGLVAYATYDLTNLATLTGFTLRVTIADMAWGLVVSAVAATAGYAAARRLG